MDYYLILARSVTYAQRMQRALERTGIHCQIARAPRDMTDLGCAYILRLAAADLAAALTVLLSVSLYPVQLFLNQRCVLREVSYDLS